MKDKKQELELSFISEASGHRHRVLDRVQVDELTLRALEEINNEDVDMQ